MSLVCSPCLPTWCCIELLPRLALISPFSCGPIQLRPRPTPICARSCLNCARRFRTPPILCPPIDRVCNGNRLQRSSSRSISRILSGHLPEPLKRNRSRTWQEFVRHWSKRHDCIVATSCPVALAARCLSSSSDQFTRAAGNSPTDRPPRPVAAPPGRLEQGHRWASTPRAAVRGGRHRQDAAG